MTVTFANIQHKLSLATILRAFVVMAAIYVIVIRLPVAETVPLWLDETWSATIATQQEWNDFWREAWLDCNPPLYYLFLSGWVSIFGDSNLMLRLPSFIFIILAMMLPIVWRPAALNQTASWTWAGLILLWPPGSLVMVDARSYALMLLLATASCLTFAKLLDRLSTKLAGGWVLLGTMMFLTHYYSAVLIAAQGIVLAWKYRTSLFRLWPAMMIAVPGVAWFALHLPRLKEYARQDVAWQQVTNVESGVGHLFYAVGALNVSLLGLILFVVGYAGFYGKKLLEKDAGVSTPNHQNLWLVASTAVIAFGLAMCVGLFQASLIDRYLVPLVPPILLGLTLIVQRGIRPEIGGILLMGAFLIPSLHPKTLKNLAEMRALYGYEQESDFVASHKIEQVIFVWDHPAAKILKGASLERIGSYFQHRGGFDIPVRTLVVAESANANSILLDASKERRTGIIWLYNTADQSSARNYPPQFEYDPAWICRPRGTEAGWVPALGTVACVNKENVID